MKEIKLIAIIMILLVLNLPLISALTISEVEAEPGLGSIKISWKTDVNADSKVSYKKGNSELQWMNISENVSQHSIQLNNLSNGSAYSFYIESSNGTDTARYPAENFENFTTIKLTNTTVLDELPTVLNTNRFTITGKAAPNSVVRFFISNIARQIQESEQEIIEQGFAVKTDSSGRFNATILLNSGTNEILIVSKSGDEISKTSYTVEIDIDAPDLYVSDVLTPRKDPVISLIGTVEEGAVVKYSVIRIINDSATEVIKANQTVENVNGSLNITISLGQKVEGKFLIIVTATDSMGNTAEKKQQIEVDNKPPELISVTLPKEGTHFSIIKVKGKVSEPGATVLIKNLNKENIIETETTEIGKNEEQIETELNINPIGELIGYDQSFEANENGEFSGFIALVEGENRLQIQVMDKAGNINAPKTESVTYTLGNSMWRVGKITTVPNCVFTDNLQTGTVAVSLMFYINYVGPGYGEVKVRGVTVSKEGAKEDNQYIGSPINTNYYYDEKTGEIFVYTKIPVTQFNGDIYTLPDELNLALMASITYELTENGEVLATEDIIGGKDESPVYFKTVIAVEKPLKYTKWLTPSMINKTIKIIDALLKPIEQLSDFSQKLSMITMGVCAVYVFSSYFMQPNYKTMYTICDRVQCPYVPPACEEFGKSFDWKNGDKAISDDVVRRYTEPEPAKASEKPYYRQKTTGEILFEDQIPAGQKGEFELVNSGDYYTIRKPEKVGDKVEYREYAIGEEDYQKYLYEFDVYQKKNINGEELWVSTRTGRKLKDAEYLQEQKDNVDVLTQGGWTAGNTYYKGATPDGKYSIEYVPKEEMKTERVMDNERIRCPSRLPNAIIISSTSKGGSSLAQGSYGLLTYENNAQVEALSQNILCTSMTRTEFETNQPSIGGISRCYTPGEPSYDETRCLDNSVRDANPFEDIFISTKCGCITGITGNLNNVVKVLEASKKCMQQAYIGQVRGGYCERLMAQFACDFIFFAIEKSGKARTSQGKDGRDPSKIKETVDDVNKRLDERYQGAFTAQFGLDSKQLVHKTCVGLISGDFSTFSTMIDSIVKPPVEPIIGPLMPESRITSYDPFTGRLTINYLFTLGIMSGGQDIEYEILLECDPDYAQGEYCPREQRAVTLDYRGYVARDGSISQNVPLVDANAVYWYNKATMTVTYNLGTQLKKKIFTEPIQHKGFLIEQCHFESYAGIRCETLVPEGLGTIEIKTMDLSPKVEEYYPQNKVAATVLAKRAGEPPEKIYLYWVLEKPRPSESEKTESIPLKGTIEISTEKLTEEFVPLDLVLFTFGESAQGMTKIMNGISSTLNEKIQPGKSMEIIAKDSSETTPIERDIRTLKITKAEKDNVEVTINCAKEENVWKCKNTLDKEVVVKGISITVESPNPVDIYRKDTNVRLFSASSELVVVAEFPDSTENNPYKLTITFYKDLNSDGKIDPEKDEIMKYKERALTQSFELKYKSNAGDCSKKPVIKIVYPYMLGINQVDVSESALLYFWDNSVVKANILDDCNKLNKDKVKLIINGKETEAKAEEEKAGLIYTFKDLKNILQQYEDKTKIEIQVKAEDEQGAETSEKVAVIRRSGTIGESSTPTYETKSAS